MADPTARLRAGYGAGPRHLLVLLLCFVVTGWVALRLAGEATAGRMLLWFVGAVIAHDLVLFPIYATVDRALRGAVGAVRGPARLALLNHIRVPALAAGLLFLVFLPGILGWGGDTYRAATGQERMPYLVRWLAVTAVLFLASAVLGAIRWALRRVGRPARTTPRR
ncbi:hypothetical protein [Micromonospora sp. WMMD812]|uniref:hypothetical protein n=1 Tax=Micromonospora sp. WMMD812 TaxID=3015152 RepID=UPI00248B9902|nr:hypothetical protein [Micromonospora sp. WMMD812]WBB68062.1 hypothetical protein O7603_01405 [Micromonospora sp. WMMD812]